MAYSNCTGQGPGHAQGMAAGLMDPGSYRNVHTGLRQGQAPDPLSTIMPVIVPVPAPVPLPCSVNKP